MTIEMLDAADSRSLLAGWRAYASYVDGAVGDQPNAAKVTAAHPGAENLTIALSAAHDADALDVEPFAAAASDVPGWIQRQHARGIARPCIYASVDLMREEIIPLIAPGAVVGWDPRLWTAHYGQGKHICGPHSCGQLPVDADGTQWTSTFQGAGGADIDASLLGDDFFGAPTPPSTVNWTEKIMQQLPEVKQGATGNTVRTVQGLCGARGHAVTVDGVFGPLTTAAVKAVQASAKIAADGIVGPQTWPVLLGV